MTDSLSDFTKSTFTYDGKTRDVYRLGEGPAVIVMAEIPGITPKVADFARRVAAIGCTVVMPVLFGDPGRDSRSGTACSPSSRHVCRRSSRPGPPTGPHR